MDNIPPRLASGIRDRIAEIIYGDGNELPWPRCLQIADTILWELNA